ncbi:MULTISPECIES: hypothetical protein [Amycolatopsis]|uniref:N-ethylmaleimide reductase n=1 Tax=Amycolatopsis albidoflavus TaxID=102226 RepID=A0ABW5I4F9_9PSEU
MPRHDSTPVGQLRLIEDGLADVLAFGTLFVSNPDLVERLPAGGPFTAADPGLASFSP